MFGFNFLNISSTSLLVEKLIKGKVVASGKGGSFLATPRSTFRALPTEIQNLDFSFDEVTRDNQQVRIHGLFSYTLSHLSANRLYDFSINKRTGKFLKDEPLNSVEENIKGKLRKSCRKLVVEKTLDELLNNIEEFEDNLGKELDKSNFDNIGVNMIAFAVHNVSSSNNDVTNAREARKREEYLTEAQNAIAKKRKEAAKNDRELRRYEAETNKLMAQEKAELIAVENANKIKVAEAEAEATKIKLAPFSEIDTSAGFISALTLMAQNGIGTVNLGDGVLEQFINNKVSSKSGR